MQNKYKCMKLKEKKQEFKKKSIPSILNNLGKYESSVFNLLEYKYSSIGSAVHRREIETGKKFSQSINRAENTLTITRTL